MGKSRFALAFAILVAFVEPVHAEHCWMVGCVGSIGHVFVPHSQVRVTPSTTTSNLNNQTYDLDVSRRLFKEFGLPLVDSVVTLNILVQLLPAGALTEAQVQKDIEQFMYEYDKSTMRARVRDYGIRSQYGSLMQEGTRLRILGYTAIGTSTHSGYSGLFALVLVESDGPTLAPSAPPDSDEEKRSQPGDPKSPPSRASNFMDAVELVRVRVLTDSVYEPWGQRGECLRFLGDGESQAGFGVVIRERHSSSCGGDPDTSPVVDRFRVERNSDVILWLDYSGEYIAYELFRRQRLRDVEAVVAEEQPSSAANSLPGRDPPQRLEYSPVPLEGQSAAQLDADDAACEALAQKATAGRIGPRDRETGEVTRDGSPIIAGDRRGYTAYRDCMYERGYRAAHEPPPPVPLERPYSDRPATWCNNIADIWDPESETCKPGF